VESQEEPGIRRASTARRSKNIQKKKSSIPRQSSRKRRRRPGEEGKNEERAHYVQHSSALKPKREETWKTEEWGISTHRKTAAWGGRDKKKKVRFTRSTENRKGENCHQGQT